MGADITLNSVYKLNYKKYEKLFHKEVARLNKAESDFEKKFHQKNVSKLYDLMYSKGYFRDSYNPTNLLWRLGISWWDDIGKLLDQDCRLPIEEVKKLRSLIADLQIQPFEGSDWDMINKKERNWNIWKNYFEKKRKRFLKLLDQSIKKNEPLDCSI